MGSYVALMTSVSIENHDSSRAQSERKAALPVILTKPGQPNMKSVRSIDHSYGDPLEVIWRSTARKIGFAITRSSEVYASWDGAGTLTLGEHDDLDEDDCLAQMILHEICHALVEGENALQKTDWGLANQDDRDVTREFAAMRLQAALLAPHGLRQFLAVTTDWRADYDALPNDPLQGDDEATQLAREAWERAQTGAWASALSAALGATAAIAQATIDFAGPVSLWSTVTTSEIAKVA